MTNLNDNVVEKEQKKPSFTCLSQALADANSIIAAETKNIKIPTKTDASCLIRVQTKQMKKTKEVTTHVAPDETHLCIVCLGSYSSRFALSAHMKAHSLKPRKLKKVRAKKPKKVPAQGEGSSGFATGGGNLSGGTDVPSRTKGRRGRPSKTSKISGSAFASKRGLDVDLNVKYVEIDLNKSPPRDEEDEFSGWNLP